MEARYVAIAARTGYAARGRRRPTPLAVPPYRRMPHRSSPHRFRSRRAQAALAAVLLGACADRVTVVPAPPPPVTLALPQNVHLMTGWEPTATLWAGVSGGASQAPAPALEWSVADSAIATVTPNGMTALVTARRAGETVVTVRAVGGGLQATSRIVVADPPPLPFPVIPPAESVVGGLTVTAVVRSDSAPVGAPRGAVRFVVAATLSNRTAAPITVRLGACPLWLTLHVDGTSYGRPGRPQVWDQLAAPNAGCAIAGGAVGETITLAPGASRTLTTDALSTSLITATNDRVGVRAGQPYAAHAHVATEGGEAVVGAGPIRPEVPAELTRMRAVAGTSGALRDTLDVRVTLTNAGTIPVKLEYGACSLQLLAYRTADRAGTPAWSSFLRQPWAGTSFYACPAYGAQATVAPGSDFSPHEFALSAPLIEMFGDSLPDGRYYFTARTQFSNAGPRDADAGVLDLALARPPMPPSRIHAAVTYRAAAVTSAGGAVHATVTATLTDAGGSRMLLPADCVVLLAAYRDRARRDAAPHGGTADWVQSTAGCSAATTETWYDQGVAHTFTTRTTARDILGAALPAGHYYFAAIVRAPGRMVYLSAGEADLAR